MPPVLCLLGVAAAAVSAPDWGKVDQVLRSQVGVAFPGAVAIVGDASGELHRISVGAHTFEPSAPTMQMDTMFDVASLTKVSVTTTVSMLLYQWGVLDLDARVADAFGPTFVQGDARKANMTVEHLLLHEAGLPPDPTTGNLTAQSYCTPGFACHETTAFPPAQRGLTFSCQARVLAELSSQPLFQPPGLGYTYSDISMITMMFLLGRLVRIHGYVEPTDLRADCASASAAGPAAAGGELVETVDQCYFEAFARAHVFAPLAASGCCRAR
jgi:CubicO group peptidase (beta-lactamase class C family)